MDEVAKRDGIGLCLSGGGYRAAIFHMGALRRLLETGVLQRIKSISSVSGGSITAAHIATQLKRHDLRNFQDVSPDEWEKLFAAPFRKIASKDIRTWPLIKNWIFFWNLWRPYVRAETLQKSYEKLVTNLKLSDLPEYPQFIFCATDIVFAVNWEFSRSRVGSYESGSVSPFPDWKLSFAVASSSCFPPLFDPMRLPGGNLKFSGGNAAKEEDFDKLVSRMRLSDGGVYDNLGMEPIWKTHETVLVSDGGAPFKFAASSSALGRVKRVLDSMGEQQAKLRRRWLIAGYNTGEFRGTYWKLETINQGKGHEGYSENFTKKFIATVRTDLDRFTEAEIAVLENHGYMTASRKLDKYCKDIISPESPPPAWINTKWKDENRAMIAMKNSDKRFSLRRLLKLDK